MPEVLDFEVAFRQIGASSCSLLLGNGFSAAHCGGYKTLLEKSGLDPQEPCRVLFDKLGEFNFERVVRVLEDASVVVEAYGDQSGSNTLRADAQLVRLALITAVRSS